MDFLPFGKLTNSSIIPQGVRNWAKVRTFARLDSHRLLGVSENPHALDVLERAFGSPRSRSSAASWGRPAPKARPGSEHRDASGV
jgi:hypothetical protein